MARAQRLAVEAPARHQARAEGLDQHVGAAGEPARELDVAGVAEVERERALVAVQPEVVGRLAVAPRRAPGARVVAAVGALDLDRRRRRGRRAASRRAGRRARARSRRRGCRRAAPSARHTSGVRTLVVSDLHLGAASGKDLLRRAELRAPLIEALRGADRLVMLGDGLELREAPHRDAAALAGPFFAEVGAALGPGRRAAVLAGNHDHGLVAGWIDARLQSEPSGFLGLSRAGRAGRGRAARRAAGGARRARRGWRSPTRACGCATTSSRSTATTSTCTRRCRRSSGWPRARWRAGSCGCRSRARGPDDYEAALAPLYAFLHQLTQRSDHAAVQRRRGRVRARVGRDGGPRARAPSGPRRGARHRLRRARSPRSTRSGSGRSTATSRAPRCGAAGCAGSARCCGGSGSPRRTCCSGTRTAPARGRATTRPSGDARPARGSWNTGSWVYQPHFLSRRAERVALLAGHRVVIEDERAAAAHPAAGGPEPPRSCRPRGEARGVAGHAGAEPEVEHALRCGARARRAGSSPARRRSSSRPLTVDRPARPRAPPRRRRPRTGRSRRRAGPRSAPGAGRPRRPRGAAARASSRSTPSSAWISRSVSW